MPGGSQVAVLCGGSDPLLPSPRAFFQSKVRPISLIPLIPSIPYALVAVR